MEKNLQFSTMRRTRKSNEPLDTSAEKNAKIVEDMAEFDENDDVFIPNPDDSGDSGDDSDPEIDTNTSYVFNEATNYRQMSANYQSSQKKLEESHEYVWINGEKLYTDPLNDEILLTDTDKQKILSSNPVELFENFFSRELKDFIISATRENGLEVSPEDFDAFIGIILFTVYQGRSSERDYWSTDELLGAHCVSRTMSRNKFLLIKSKLKYHFPSDLNAADNAWRVRPLLNIFRKNIKKFTFFSTAISVDEMMCKYYGRCKIKQYIPTKPDPYAIKFWGCCGSSGYLFELDIYCGKSATNDILAKCALSSRVVLQMLEPLMQTLTKKKLGRYHLYIDNFFTSPDLLVHLKKAGISATGTVRENRIKEKNDVPKDAARGTYAVKHDQNSGINFITVKDSKLVSVLSTAAGVTPEFTVQRYDKESKSKKPIPFPNAFSAYNKFMGGVDIHDMYCNIVRPIIRSKKWTF